MDGERTQEVYDRAGFGAAVARGSRPAIVVVDLSRGFTEERFSTGADLTSVVEANVALIRTARAVAAPVLFTTIAFDDADVAGGCAWLRKAPGLAVLRAGSELVEIDARLGRESSDALVVKRGASAFFGTNLAAVLVARGVDTLIVTGAVTSGCVRATVVDAVQSGFPVLVPREAVGDRARGPHDANLFDIQAKYGDVLSVAEVLGYLGSLGPAAEAAPPAAVREGEPDGG